MAKRRDEDEDVHCMTLRVRKPLYEDAVRVANGVPLSVWIRRLIEQAVAAGRTTKKVS